MNWGTETVEDLAAPLALVENPERFDEEVVNFVDQAWGENREISLSWKEPFLQTVALPTRMAYHFYKHGDFVSALGFADQIASEDWRLACTQWLNRRLARRQKV